VHTILFSYSALPPSLPPSFSLEAVNVKLLGKDVGYWTISVWRGGVGVICCLMSYHATARKEGTNPIGRRGGREAGREGGREAGREGGREGGVGGICSLMSYHATARKEGTNPIAKKGREGGREGGEETLQCNLETDLNLILGFLPPCPSLPPSLHPSLPPSLQANPPTGPCLPSGEQWAPLLSSPALLP